MIGQMIAILSLLQLSFITYAGDALPEGKMDSPYESCKNVLVVSKQQYVKNKNDWDTFQKQCKQQVQFADEAGLTSLDPLKDGVEYLSFSQKVAQKIIENLKKNRAYANCSASCFSGAVECPADEKSKTVQCSERKKDIQEAMKVFTRKIRIELALSNDSPGMINVNVLNALEFSKSERYKDRFINTDLRDFEAAMPNPVGRLDLSERELKEAQRRVARDHADLEKEYQEGTHANYAEWMSKKLIDKFEEHRERYREIVYEEAPIFAVIDRPVQMESGKDPVWSDEQIAKAFTKLSDNTKSTEEKVNWSLGTSKLEFSRFTGESELQWLGNLTPGVLEKNDLLYYMGMKSAVEDVLRDDTSLCAVATSMDARLHSKGLQNSGAIIAVTMAGAPVIKSASAFGSSVFRIGKALTGAEAAGVTGLAQGGIYLGDNLRRYRSISSEAETTSGLGGDKESKALRSSENIADARGEVKIALAFIPLDFGTRWGFAETLYSGLNKQMEKDLPELGALFKEAKLSTVARDHAVDSWLVMKVKTAVKTGVLSDADEAALKSSDGRGVLETLTKEIQKSNPAFFKDATNLDFFFKTAATTIKKEKGDPSDLGDKTKLLLLHFNGEAMSGAWGSKGKNALLEVFDDAIAELRVSAKNDPATYAKFTTDPASQEKILTSALKRAGVEDKDLPSMVQCALPR